MADIELKYLTELPPATSMSDGDLLHLNQGGIDKSIALEVIKRAIIDVVYPPNSGKVAFFAKVFNPNNEYPGTTWSRVPGMGKTIRLASEGMGDVLTSGGSDSVELSSDNMPPHSHLVNINTSTYDYGSKQTTANGKHSHRLEVRVSNFASETGGNDVVKSGGGNTFYTSEDGEHSHSVPIGSHSHSVNGYTADSAYNNSPINTTNQYVKLVAWYRVS